MVGLVNSQDLPAVLLAESARLRTRPGERVTWIDASAFAPFWNEWRGTADDRGVPLDALLSVLLEHHLVMREFNRLGVESPEQLLGDAADDGEVLPRLAPTDHLRLWIQTLKGQRRAHPSLDELPELAVPQRLVHLVEPGFDLGTAMKLGHADSAIHYEVTAARFGLTMQAWALGSILAHRSMELIRFQ